jgi:hypothetical protein
MSSDARDNAPTSGTTYTTSREKHDRGATTTPTAPPADKPDAKLSESEYLARQAQEAKTAISRAWSDFSMGLAQGVDPREWTRDYPLTALSTALAAGFVAAITLVPSKEDQALKKLARLERAINPPPGRERLLAAMADEGSEKAKQKGILGELLNGIARTLGPALGSAISAAVAAKAGASDTNGQHDGANPPPDLSEPPA